MANNPDLQHHPNDGDKRVEKHHSGDPAHTASHKLSSEAASEWHRQAQEARKAPLSVLGDKTYEVKHGDCLSDIAARRLHTDHEKVDSHSIAKEEKRLRELNSDQFKTLGSHDKKQRDFLADGWHLKIYDSVHDKKTSEAPKAAPEAPKAAHDAPKVAPHEAPHEAPKVAPEAPKAPVAAAPEIPIPHPRPINGPLELHPHHVDGPHRDSEGHVRPHHRRHPGHHPAAAPESTPEQEAPAGRTPPPEKTAPDTTERRRPADRADDLEPPTRPGHSPEGKMDRSKFYYHQTDNHSCSAVALAMMYANTEKGSPPSPREVEHFKAVTGTIDHGYRGSLDAMASQARSQGMEAKAYQYGRFGENGMNDLDRELAAGHTAVARIINPHTGNPHYIYVAGKDSRGNYVIGDPDRKNNANFGHDRPISRSHLLSMMSGRDGFVAGWS